MPSVQVPIALAGKVSLVTAQIVCILALLWGQSSSERPVRLPPVDDIGSSLAADGLAAELYPFASDGPQESLNEPWPEPLEEIPANRLAVTWITGGGQNGFGNIDFDLNRTWMVSNHPDVEPLAITPGFGWHLWIGPQTLDLPSQVYDLYLDLSWRFWQREQNGLAIGLTPGIYGDFEQLDSEAFQLTGWLMGNHRFNEHWNLVGGIAYVRQLNSHLLPIGGVIWTPNEHTQVEILIPRPRIARRIRIDDSREVWWYVAGQFGGGAWAVADTATENVLVSYSDLRILLGIQVFRDGGSELSLEIGYVFNRDISINQISVLEPDTAFLIQAATAF